MSQLSAGFFTIYQAKLSTFCATIETANSAANYETDCSTINPTIFRPFKATRHPTQHKTMYSAVNAT
jgi:hypothetical protein